MTLSLLLNLANLTIGLFYGLFKPNYRIVLRSIVPNGGIRGKLVQTLVLVHNRKSVEHILRSALILELIEMFS